MPNDQGLALREAERLLKNAAGQMGANTVRWDRIYTRSVEGTAFVCPPAARIDATTPSISSSNE